MKTMTCKQMGGPCDAPIKGSTAEEMMANGGKHLTEMSGDPAHKAAFDMMQETGKDPVANQKWMDGFKTQFDALPMDQ